MQTSEQQTIKKNNRWTIIGLFIVFSAPMVIAYSGWFLGWFDTQGTTHHGDLIKPVITLENSGLQLEQAAMQIDDLNEHWWIIYVTDDEHCGLACQANAYLINQTRTAQAKELSRIEKLIVGRGVALTVRSKNYINEHFGNNVFATLLDASLLEARKIYLMDPHGNIFIYYPAVEDEKQAVKAGRGMIQDLKKLLKISQIG